MKSEEKSSCCAPSEHRQEAPLSVSGAVDRMAAGDQATADPMSASVSLPGGRFLMGTDYARGFPADGEGPVRAISLSPFAIDIFPVTNARFAAFVEATNYRTEAEIFAWSFVFWSHIPPDRFEDLVEDTAAYTPWWCKVPGATWNHPEGPGSDVNHRQNHPVVHVSWNDASAYATWASSVLPSEAQWEYAARGGLEQKLYPWGDELVPGGVHRCNIWQGKFPEKDTAEDGYAGTCPVTGNVWEWCADWFHTKFSSPAHDPLGPSHGESKVMKGGSFLCHASYCNRYRVAARTSNTPDSSASNIGFRCVRAKANL
jgi:sulfatase modifying factor 1